ncbi:MAG TPA: hypothetical protein VJ753_05855 [Rhizomicrobium sp.]|nr:hypothetical protein [Rhizomicrobium sp.]
MPNRISDSSALELPAPYVNQFQVLVAGSNIRVAFAEKGPGEGYAYRSAVVMSSGDAVELVGYLLDAIKTITPLPPLPPTGGIFGVSGPGLINTPKAPGSGGIFGSANYFADKKDV